MITHEIDATNQSLGRLSTKIATMLRGKDTAAYEPSVLPKIEVVVTNIDKIDFKGTKFDTKKYFHYSGYPSGMKERSLEVMWQKNPQFVVRHSVHGMLPKNKSRDKIIKNLKFK